jgi:hypothetical protein
VSACDAFQKHAAIPEMQQESVASSRTSDLPNRRKPTVDDVAEILMVHRRPAKPSQDAKKHDVIMRRKFDAPLSSQDTREIRHDLL